MQIETTGAEIVARNGSMSWTRAECEALFNQVVNAENWKKSIDALVEFQNDRDLLGTREAVIFYTGSVPTIEFVIRRPEHTTRWDGGHTRTYRVRAAGYYQTIGA